MGDPAVRAPRQRRTTESWERILAVGLELLESGGAGALTISEVCRRAGVSAPSIYARVDGRAGLFAAVYERGMDLVVEAEAAAVLRNVMPDASPADQVRAGVSVLAEVFDERTPFMRAVIQHSAVDAGLLTRGSAEAKRVMEVVARALPGDAAAAREVATTLFAECVVRVMYGSDFFRSGGEPLADFIGRLSRLASARLGV
jgi:AcrR family transcriptional regulator